jgi:glycosyltransferase involved in cell wall biosynthesis
MKTTKDSDLVSVVIPTYKPERTIQKCVTSIIKQTYPHIEILIVDSKENPMDNTLVRTLTKSATVLSDGPERSIQRNRGMREAKGKYICMVDQDMYLSERLIAESVSLLQKDYIALTIPEVSIGEGFWTKCVALERYVNTYLENGQNECCRFFRKKDGEAVAGYDPDIVGAEDADFHAKMKRLGRIGKTTQHIIHDEGRTRFFSRVQKKYYYSKAFRKFLSRYPTEAAVQFSPLKLTYVKHWRLFIKQPVVTGGVILLRSAEVTAGVFGLLFNR